MSLSPSGPFNLSVAPKWRVHRGVVNGDDALILGPDWGQHHPTLSLQVYRYARIPEGYQPIETETEYVGLLDEQTGDSRDLKWELIPGDARVQIVHIAPFYP